MPWLLYLCKFFCDFLCSDMSLLFVTVTLRGVSNKHWLLSLFSFGLHAAKTQISIMIRIFAVHLNG